MTLNSPALWRNRGRHRAADQIPLIEADRDRWKALALARQDALTHADTLMSRVCKRAAATAADNARLRAELDTAREAHQFLLDDYDELAARLTEERADRANLQAVSIPAPADDRPAIQLVDYDTTVAIPVSALWDVLGNPPRVAA